MESRNQCQEPKQPYQDTTVLLFVYKIYNIKKKKKLDNTCNICEQVKEKGPYGTHARAHTHKRDKAVQRYEL